MLNVERLLRKKDALLTEIKRLEEFRDTSSDLIVRKVGYSPSRNADLYFDDNNEKTELELYVEKFVTNKIKEKEEKVEKITLAVEEVDKYLTTKEINLLKW